MRDYLDIIALGLVGMVVVMLGTIWLFADIFKDILVNLGVVVMVFGAVFLAIIGMFATIYLLNFMRKQSEDRYTRQIEHQTLLVEAQAKQATHEFEVQRQLLELERLRIENHNLQMAGSVFSFKHNERVIGLNGAPKPTWEIEPMLKAPKPLPQTIEGETPTMDMLAKPVEDIRRGEGWIQEFLFDSAGEMRAYHLKLDGPTGAGKTWFTLYLMWLLQQPYPAAEYWLSDPKFEGEESGWPFDPFVQDFDDTALGAQYMYENVVTQRKHAKREGQPIEHPAFMIFDEADGCFDEHGDKFSKPVRRIVKEGRSGQAHAVIVGQSALVKDVGFSGALLRNTGRFVMGSEALAFIRNPQFNHWDNNLRNQWKEQLVYLQEHGKRYALAIPASGQGLPFVGEVPHLNLPTFVQKRPSLTIIDGRIVDSNIDWSNLSEQERTAYQLSEQGLSANQISKKLYGYTNGRTKSKVDNLIETAQTKIMPTV